MTSSSDPILKQLPTSRFTRFVTTLAKVFYFRRVYGAENIDRSRASVFTCNHGRISGPITAVAFLPVRFRPWINACMLERSEATETMMRTFRDRFRLLRPKMKRRLIWHISGPVCHFLNSLEPIPVYKGMPRESAGTIEQSVEALARGENLLIFPEKPSDRYDDHSYKAFHTGFATLGKAYFERTGRALDFYPCFSDRKTRSFRIGKPVTYDPSDDSRSEKLRISEELSQRMAALKAS